MVFTANMTADLPQLPEYTTHPMPALVPLIPDKYLTLVLPIIAYWAFSMIFHYIDEKDWFPQYRLHTPVEVSNRNHVSRWEVVRDVVIQQFVQTVVGVFLARFDADQYTGMDDYNVAVWAQRIRIAQRFLPSILATVGLDAVGLAEKVSSNSPAPSGALLGGYYSSFNVKAATPSIPQFAPWELAAASIIYYYMLPAFQFVLAILIVDTWQYFLHRAMHMNKWLYTTFHSRHHRLYVPYAYGALYNHPFEGFLLDTCGTGVAYLIAGLTPRQSMWFFTGSTMKTVDDHCGYAFPWDPFQHLTGNNAGYHDVHHQSWGIKTNFSQPFFTFWDRLLGTVWTGGDVSARYERSRLAAEKKHAQNAQAQSITGSSATDSTAAPSDAPYDGSDAPQLRAKKIQPQPSAGKATAQAVDSRKQVVNESGPAGGMQVLAEETAEEQREREANCLPGVMRPTSGGSGRDGGMMKAMRERVHKRKGSLLGGAT